MRPIRKRCGKPRSPAGTGRSIAERRVVRAWTATYNPALAVTAGETVTPGRIDEEYPGWQWVENARGQGGWVPADIVDGTRVTEDFDTMELTAAPGDRVEPLESRLGWTRARAGDGREGWIPSTCLD
ncbi:hypothetical protein HKCCE3408_01255 [Rhodobacterales bacterium HKCCE3408]|nr:hypothetical protein [Rhodobacterales bacterium HKCCE3408]